ncbi:class I SAM-dependent methyltransferase [Nocardioides sp. CFH 31398]|uniref:class I SAM-dependent methyltransferase n=1 Tax=Nocardioides sp. CFH 31398 TaxID=2919579 RepID=UPI001F066F55|nr:class I SAM-dependent methyltransferase [Nocardioides sp. CFH 31398]MCH1865127.1 class I SAM-dependent methyltransferase [Nocardioides sp. CFH 31398]
MSSVPGLATGAIPSPNIWHHTATYEVENHAFDPDGLVESAMLEVLGAADLSGRTVLDLGCGTGFHLPRFAATASSVVGVEPHPGLLRLARRRVAGTPSVDVRHGSAQQVPLPDASVDVVHARWAYFFGPGCEPGLRELSRVVRRGGTAFVLDNDGTTSTFGAWFRRGYPKIRADEVERFWAARGWRRTPIATCWRFTSRADLEAVVRIEFDRATADAILTEHPPSAGLEVDYAVNLWWRTF